MATLPIPQGAQIQDEPIPQGAQVQEEPQGVPIPQGAQVSMGEDSLGPIPDNLLTRIGARIKGNLNIPQQIRNVSQGVSEGIQNIKEGGPHRLPEVWEALKQYGKPENVIGDLISAYIMGGADAEPSTEVPSTSHAMSKLSELVGNSKSSIMGHASQIMGKVAKYLEANPEANVHEGEIGPEREVPKAPRGQKERMENMSIKEMMQYDLDKSERAAAAERYEANTPSLPKGELVRRFTDGPKYVYRARSIGEEGIPKTTGSASATNSKAEATTYLAGREAFEGKPQELVRIDLNKLDSQDYTSRPHPNGSQWYIFHKDIPEDAVEILQSKSKQATASSSDK